MKIVASVISIGRLRRQKNPLAAAALSLLE